MQELQSAQLKLMLLEPKQHVLAALLLLLSEG